MLKESGLTITLRQLEKDVSNFSKTGVSRRTINYLKGRLAMLEKSMETADGQYSKVLSAYGDDDEQELAAVEAVYDKIREGYFEYRSDLLDSIDKAQASKVASGELSQDHSLSVPPTCRSSEIRLPKINLPTFAGNYETWRAFHDIFVSLIHNNTALSETQKMHYLKSSVSGEAEKLLAHLGLERGNYDKAWEILTDRYDHQRFLVTSQLKCLFNQPVVVQEQAEAIKQLLDTSTEVIHSLAKLKVPVDQWDILLIFVLLQKLPVRTQQLWEERLGSKTDSKALPTFSEFSQFLETRFRTLEAVAQQQQTRTSSTYNKPLPRRNALHIATNSSQYSCQICSKGQHAVRKCGKFLKMSIDNRLRQVNRIGLCRNCLAYTHHSEYCPSSRRCYYCQQAHHSLLHSGNVPSISTSAGLSQPSHNSGHPASPLQPTAPSFQPAETRKSQNVNALYSCSTHCETQALLATAVVNVTSITGQPVSLRALLDSGSEASFITASAAHLLGLPLRSTSVEVSGLGLVNSGVCYKMIDIVLKSHQSDFQTSIQTLVLKTLSGHLPAQTLTTIDWEYLNGLGLADPYFNKSAKVDLLLGSDILAEVVLPELIRPNNEHLPIAQKTKLGWVLFGRVPIPHRVNSFLQTCRVEAELRKFWELEEMPLQSYTKPEDIECEKYFLKNVKRLTDGHFQVALPFKGTIRPLLGSSKDGALKRFKSLERKLEANPQLKQQYADCLEEYLTLGHMEEVQQNSISDLHHYFLPHHAVLKESSSTTKLRVVFDASFKTADGISLNDQLMIGPALQHNITDIVLRWRLHRYSFTADIEKMYRQIWVPHRDSQYQLILWRRQQPDPLKIYRLKTVTFGTASAPYLAIRTLLALAEQVDEIHPEAAKTIRAEMYVDDLISGAETLQEAKLKVQEIKNVLGAAGFHLRKWTANDKGILDDIPSQDHEQLFSVPMKSLAHVKTLGIQWLPLSDVFSFEYSLPNIEQPTKRSILSSIARLFDPMGWIAPSIIKAKLIMQLLWVRKQSWDDSVDQDILEEWITFHKDLPSVNNLRIPRWLHTKKTMKRIELHGFSDASEKAYGATVYLRAEDENGTIHMHLLMAKSRVAPVKPVTLPRLELCGAFQLAKLLDYVTQTLEWRGIPTFAWTDSTITLCWIRAEPSKWDTFVRNRVGEIQQLTDISIWNHIPSQENPADYISRGLLPSTLLQCSLWWNGPTFLRSSWKFQLPNQPKNLDTDEGIKNVTVLLADVEIIENSVLDLIHRVSSWKRLSRITAYCQRFIANIKRDNAERSTGPLEPVEIKRAEKVLIRIAQIDMFRQGTFTSKGIRSLACFTDSDGIVRVGGRLKNAGLSYDQRHPILLQPTHFLTRLLIRDAHDRTFHGGMQMMIGHLRIKYWIIQVKRAIKKHIHGCTICYRYRSKVANQLMGDLPSPRVNIAKPFTHTGVDYAGPVDIKAWKGRGSKTHKGYLAIFICLTTKALHLEAVTDLTSQAFLAAFRRFVARRGFCREIHSDCGSNFVGAEAELHRLLKNAMHDWTEVAEALANQEVHWRFIPPASPHFGGLWEAGVKSVKYHLKRIAGNSLLTYEELATLLTQIEACLNSRPLCPLSEDPDDFRALTPAHFLVGQELLTIPEPDIGSNKINFNDRWKLIQLRMQTFWKHWQQEYLSRLQQRPKWLKQQPSLKMGDLVLLKDERLPPSKWRLGRILETYPGADNLVRVVKIKTQAGEFKRPITKLCPLPINNIYTEDIAKTSTNDTI